MANSDHISPELLKGLLESNSIEELSTEQLLASFLNDDLHKNIPGFANYAVDPRSGEPIIFNPARAVRPHDYQSTSDGKIVFGGDCPICAGKSTTILDLAPLQNGSTFINKNLYPVLNPPSMQNLNDPVEKNRPWGFHFVQWTSSYHNQDWHNLTDDDCVVVMSRLVALEKKLIQVGNEVSEHIGLDNTSSASRFYISMIKNVGSAVGGSLEHGHQQIILGNIAPRRILNNQKFQDRHMQTFSEYLLKSSQPDLLINDYGSASLLVADFMRRPFEMILVLRDYRKANLHELSLEEIQAISKGWKDATRAYQMIMPGLGREIAYNVVMHNGPGAGLYFEFLPYTQEQGGFENLGLSVCDAEPIQTAKQIRDSLN